MEIVLENVKLSTYDNSNVYHKNLLYELENNSKSIYIHDIGERLVNTKNKKTFPFGMGFVVSVNGVFVGYLYLSTKLKDEVFLEYSIIKEFRGKKFGKLLLKEVSDFLMNNCNVKSIVLDIDPSNIPSIMTAISAFYIEDEDEYLERNMNGKILYRIDNANYVNKRKK